MTRHEMEEILKRPFYERRSKGLQTFKWENYTKSFKKISSDLAMEHLLEKTKGSDEPEVIILKCTLNSETYYFGVDLSDCDNITLKELKELYKNGTWYVYTWSD